MNMKIKQQNQIKKRNDNKLNDKAPNAQFLYFLRSERPGRKLRLNPIRRDKPYSLLGRAG
jgi:hypothetical protein